MVTQSSNGPHVKLQAKEYDSVDGLQWFYIQISLEDSTPGVLYELCDGHVLCIYSAFTIRNNAVMGNIINE